MLAHQTPAVMSVLRRCIRTMLAILVVALLLVAVGSTAWAQTNVPTAPDIQVPPGSTYLPPPENPDPPAPYDNAAAVGISAPATMAPGATAYVTVTMRNSGTTTWYPGLTNPYRLGSQNPADNRTWGIGRVELASTVAPGGQAVFGFTITAPSTPGTYSFSWEMLREGLFWFGGIASSTITVSAPSPVYDAQMTLASVPARMTAGSKYTVSLTFKNTGNVTWAQSDYRLGSTSPNDNTTWGLSRVNLGVASVAGGQSTTFNFQVTAPSTAGTYLFDWGMLWEYHMRFGQTSKVYVTVDPVSTTLQPTVTVSRPSSLVAGQTFTTTWSTTNATSLTHVCTASGTGYAVNESLAVNGSRTLTAQSGWVGYPSSCTWTASGAGGSATYTETMTTVAGSSGTVTYIHTDGLGSPVARTNASGTVISRTRYEPYGYVASGVQPTIGFTGHVNDVDTGLTYMQQRYYDPVAGRFLSIDPVTTDANTGGSFNRYAYANNSPYKYVDPDGRDVIGWLVKLLDNGGKVFVKKLDKTEAVAARRAGQNVQAATKSDAKQIEIAARGGNKEGILQHKGHELKDGSAGDPHFQTEGVSGHTFWGGEAGAVTVEMLEAWLVPLFATPSGLAPGTLYGPGTPYKNSAEYDEAMREKDDKSKQKEEEKPKQPQDK